MVVPFLLAVGGLSLLGFTLGRRKKKSSSATSYVFTATSDERTELMPDVLTEDGTTVDVDDATWLKLGDALGAPYKWGGGGPSTPWTGPDMELDCGGWLQVALVRLGKLKATAADRGVIDLANASDPIAVGSQRPGDIAVYRGRHGMLVVSDPRDDIGGHSHVMGASGGSSTIQGYDPSGKGYSANARVKLFRTAGYRPDFLTYARLRQ